MALCTGKACWKSAGFPELERALSEACAVVTTRCMGECKGLVVVIHPGSAEPIVLKRVRKPKQRRDLLAFLFGAKALSGRLTRRAWWGVSERRRSRRLAGTSERAGPHRPVLRPDRPVHP